MDSFIPAKERDLIDHILVDCSDSPKQSGQMMGILIWMDDIYMYNLYIYYKIIYVDTPVTHRYL